MTYLRLIYIKNLYVIHGRLNCNEWQMSHHPTFSISRIVELDVVFDINLNALWWSKKTLFVCLIIVSAANMIQPPANKLAHGRSSICIYPKQMQLRSNGRVNQVRAFIYYILNVTWKMLGHLPCTNNIHIWLNSVWVSAPSSSWPNTYFSAFRSVIESQPETAEDTSWVLYSGYLSLTSKLQVYSVTPQTVGPICTPIMGRKLRCWARSLEPKPYRLLP